MNISSRLQQAIKSGHATILTTGKRPRITYNAVNVTEFFDDPEEQVRAEFWAELIDVYGYEPRCIGVEVTIPDRVPTDRADLVVYKDSERKRPYAVVECKKTEVSDAEYRQAIEQAFGNGTWAKLRAEYVMVVAGETRTVFDVSNRFGIMERDTNIIADLPRAYGKPVEWRFTKKGQRDLRTASTYELKAILGKCHQTLWGGGRLSPTAAFGELCKIVFVKINDELAAQRRKQGEPYQFQIKSNESAHALARRIRTLYSQQRERDPEIFADDIRIADETLRLVVSHLESVNLTATQLDVKGEAFQKFMSDFFKGSNGQFYTPTPLVKFAVKMVKPTAEDRVLDPACGSGGFLLQALDAIREEADDTFRDHKIDPEESRLHYTYWHDFAAKNLFGIEINEEIARVAKMNMILHDDGHTNVISEDALERLPQMQAHSGNSQFKRDSFDIILTNPPFGATIARSERPYLEDYDLGRTGEGQKRKPRSNQKSEILFLERIHTFLRPGTGRAAIVVPDGILTNSSLQYVRDYLLEKFQLHAVISFPVFAFAHFGAGVKSSLILVRRRAEDEKPSNDEPVFMAAPEYIGYDATGRETSNDLVDIEKQYREFQRSSRSFFV